jgi:acetyl-CoA carboxylase carboxyltransferase component
MVARVGAGLCYASSMTALLVPLRAGVRGAASAAVHELGGRPVVLVRTDPTHHRGALGSDDGATIAVAAGMALDHRIPLVAVLSTAGADVNDGMPALHGWGQAAAAVVRCTGIVPIVMIVTGAAVSGPALLLGLANIVIMTEGAFAFVSGPNMVEEFTGVRMDAVRLGGAGTHGRASGVCTFQVPDEQAGLALAASVLSFLPSHADEPPPSWPNEDPVDRPTAELRTLIPATPTGSYDVRRVIEALADDHEVLELCSQWAPNIVTAFITIDGQPVGVIANQPQSLAGTLDIPASQKGARFVALCDSFGVPLLTLVDTPGYFPGKDLEWRGIIRKGAQLAFAYAEATVPRVCVIMRKSYGGAYIVMDSKRMGNDVCIAWPSAEVAVMGAPQAVQILYRDLDVPARLERQADFERVSLTPYVAAERGFVDVVIDPAETRTQVAGALAQLASKFERVPRRKHSNIPL